MLKMNPTDRITAEKALNHEWIKNKAPRAENVPLGDNAVTHLKNFRSTYKLKKMALHIVASNMNDSQIQELRKIFSELNTSSDVQGDGQVTTGQMKAALLAAGIEEAELNRIAKEVDS